MNSLSLLSSRVIGKSPSSRTTRHQRSRSQGEILPAAPAKNVRRHRSYSEDNVHATEALEKILADEPRLKQDIDHSENPIVLDEKEPLVQHHHQRTGFLTIVGGPLRITCHRTFNAIGETIRYVLSTLLAPGVYIARCFLEDNGRYSLIAPLRKLRRSRNTARRTNSPVKGRMRVNRNRSNSIVRRSDRPSRDSLISSSTSESEDGHSQQKKGRHHRASKSRSSGSDTDGSTPWRSIRIKLNDETLPQRRERRRSSRLGDGTSTQAAVNLDSLKSPTSPSVHKITRYPPLPTLPRPLIPPRKPSYTLRGSPRIPQKTLVLDLDETLIHSLAKGGRMSSGHMVEVKLSVPMITALTPGGPPTALGPQHPILYYVHKRPHCDEFLRKVCKWYKLVVFTASVQEYADPVIDWLEQERKFFQARYYRQHCTFRNGAYIKDLSAVEPDLSKVMILDNSPMSYIFHEGRT